MPEKNHQEILNHLREENAFLRSILEKTNQGKELIQQKEEFSLLLQVGKRIVSELDLDKVFELVASKAREIVQAEMVLVPMLNEERDRYTYMAASGDNSEEVLLASYPVHVGMCGWVLEHKQSLYFGESSLFSMDEKTFWEQGQQSAILVPLFGQNMIIGGLSALGKKGGGSFSLHDLDVLTLFANQISVAIENAVLFQKLKNEIAEREKAEEKLLQSQKMESIGTLAGGIAHDFNNILSAIVGYTDLALSKNRNKNEVEEDLRQVRIAAARATGLIKQILTFGRRQQQEKIPLQLSLVITEAIKLLRASIPTTIDIRQDITTEGVVLADPTQIHQVIMNLCTNAYHAMLDRGGILSISLKEITLEQPMIDGTIELAPGRYLKLSVTDTGCGMDRVTLARIFDPYYTTKVQGSGTGLGLSVVHGIVMSHQGKISVYSEPGQGTTFNVYLPMITQEISVAPAVEPLPPRENGHERIMVVDDDDAIRDLTSQILANAGYRVDLFTNGTEAWAALCNSPDNWDLLLTDQTMPGMTGNQLAANLQDLRAALPVIICSGYCDIREEKGAQALGIRSYLQKPVSASTLLAAVAAALADTPARDRALQVIHPT